MGLRRTVVSGYPFGLRVLRPFLSDIPISPFVFATPDLSLFNVFRIIHGWFPPYGKCSAGGGTGISHCSSSLHFRVLCRSGGSWIAVELAIKLLRDLGI